MLRRSERVRKLAGKPDTSNQATQRTGSVREDEAVRPIAEEEEVSFIAEEKEGEDPTSDEESEVETEETTAVMTSTPEIFESNPFSANINPMTTNGLKLYQAATAKRDESDLLTTKISTARQFIEAMKEDATKFSWGKLTSTVVVGTEEKDILEDFKDISVEKVRLRMNSIFYSRTDTTLPTLRSLKMFDIDPANNDGDKPIFYARVRANIIGLRILASLTKASVSALKLKQGLYLWKSTSGETYYDGPTMLQLCIEKVNPNTRVGVAHLKESLRNAKLSVFGHNVSEMTDKMTSLNDEIIQRGFSHDDYVLDLYQALLSGKNDVFTSYIQRKRDDWDTGVDTDPDDLISDAVTKYNNMVIRDTWKLEEPKNAKIAALTTQVKTLQDRIDSGQFQKKSDGNEKGNGYGKGKVKGDFQIQEWRLTKTLGDKVEKEGKTWHWCDKQHNDGKGMYVRHHPDDHTDWLAAKKKSKDDKKGDKSDSKPNGKLALSDNLKAAMVTKFKCSKDDAEKLWKDVVGNSSN